MKTSHLPAFACVSLLIASAGFPKAAAKLPFFGEQPWMGYFAVYQDKGGQFGISAHGDTTFLPMNEKGKPMGAKVSLAIDFGIEEVQPDGKIVWKTVQVESLESPDPATKELEKTVIRGKVTGDAAFEAIIEQERGLISIGGRVIDAGSLTANPLRFAVRVKIPNVYEKVEKTGKKDLRAFEKRIRKDHIELQWTDGKRLKQGFEEAVDVNTKEINGPGISEAEVEIDYYQGRKLFFAASEGSSFHLWKGGLPEPLHHGFSLRWVADAAKDPKGESRFSMRIK